MTSTSRSGSAAPPTAALRRAARGSTLNAVGSAVAAVATFGLTVIVTRASSTVDAGTFFTATAIFMLGMGLAQLGTNAGLVYFLSGSRALGEYSDSRKYMHVASRPVLVCSATISIAILVFARPLAALIDESNASRIASFLVPVALFIPFAAAFHLAVSGTRGLGTMKVYAALDQVTRPVAQVVLVAGAVLLVGFEAAPWAWVVIYVPLALVAWMWWRRLARNQGLSPESESRPWGQFWRFSSPRALATVTQVAMQRFDIILVSALAGLTQAAIYAAATRFIALGSVAARAVGLSSQPLIREKLAAGDHDGAEVLYQTSTAWLVLLTWPLYLTLLVFGETALRIFGAGYDAGASALAILCLAMLVATCCGIVDMVLMMAGKSTWALVNVVIAFAVNVGVDLLLIPRMGVLGAAIGWAAAILIVNLLPLTQLIVWRRLHPVGRSSLTAVALTIALFGLLPALVRLVVENHATALLISLPVSVVLYASALWFWRDQLQLMHFLHALPRQRRSAPTSTQDT